MLAAAVGSGTAGLRDSYNNIHRRVPGTHRASQSERWVPAARGPGGAAVGGGGGRFAPFGSSWGEEKAGSRGPGLLALLSSCSSASAYWILYLPRARLQGHLRTAVPAAYLRALSSAGSFCPGAGAAARRVYKQPEKLLGVRAGSPDGESGGRAAIVVLRGSLGNPRVLPSGASLQSICGWHWKVIRAHSQGVPDAARGLGAHLWDAAPEPGFGAWCPSPVTSAQWQPPLPSLARPGERNGETGGAASESSSAGRVSSESKSRP
ncbi:uncharacterized protein LOC144331419 [Macaca mulatta]